MFPPLRRLPEMAATTETRAGDAASFHPPEVRAEMARVRAAVAHCLDTLSRRIEKTFAPALAGALRAWEQVDSLVIIDTDTGIALAQARRMLDRVARTAEAPLRAVAAEGLLALDTACGLAGLAERRLSSLIRSRVRSEDKDLLPGGRPFLDLAPALAEAARAWT